MAKTAKDIVRIPVSELKPGDEYWGDIWPDDKDDVEIIGSSLLYTIGKSTGDLTYSSYYLTWEDGSVGVRTWDRHRTLTVRR